MKSKVRKGKIMVFLFEFFIIGYFLCEFVCKLNEISMKGMRDSWSLKAMLSTNHALKEENV